jgi:two-component system CheB/CheR fusion protein
VDEFVLIRIEDNGLGIDLQKYGNSLFEPFKRLTTQGEGSGLGLHLVKTMVEHNGGLIQVKSEPGIGTSFTLYLKEYEDNK